MSEILSADRTIQDSRLNKLDPDELLTLYKRRDKLFIDALVLRGNGEKRMRVFVFGNKDSLHDYSHNKVIVSFLDATLQRETYHSTARIRDLRKNYYGGNIRELIGEPDGYIREPGNDYVARNIAEINELTPNLIHAERAKDRAATRRLKELHVRLAENVLQARADGIVGSGQIRVILLKGRDSPFYDLIDIEF